MQTKILIATSNVFVHYWYVILLVPIIIAGAVFFSIQTNPKARHAFDGFKLKVPMLGDILRKIILSRFASVFAMMYGSGISILDSIKTTERIVGNSVIREGLEEVGQMIDDGKTSPAFQNVGLFPPLVIRMLRVGENTGGLDTALMNVSYFYNRDVKESIERTDDDRTGDDHGRRPDSWLGHAGRARAGLRHHQQAQVLTCRNAAPSSSTPTGSPPMPGRGDASRARATSPATYPVWRHSPPT